MRSSDDLKHFFLLEGIDEWCFFKFEGMEIGLTVELKNQQGTLRMSLLDCGCHVKDVSIKMDGGASWLYQGYEIL